MTEPALTSDFFDSTSPYVFSDDRRKCTGKTIRSRFFIGLDCHSSHVSVCHVRNERTRVRIYLARNQLMRRSAICWSLSFPVPQAEKRVAKSSTFKGHSTRLHACSIWLDPQHIPIHAGSWALGGTDWERRIGSPSLNLVGVIYILSSGVESIGW